MLTSLLLLGRLFAGNAFLFAPDTGAGSGGADPDDDDANDLDGDPDGDPAGGEDDDDDPGDDPEALKAALAAARSDSAKWKSQSRKHEARAKEGRKAIHERDELKRKGLAPDERALEEARDAGRAEAARDAAMKIARTEVRSELKGRVSDAQREALIDALDLSKFLDDDNEVDTDRVSEWADSVAPSKSDKGDAGAGKKKPTDLGQGRRAGGNQKPSVQDGMALYEQRHARKHTSTTTT